MLDVLCPLITEADFISNELLDTVLINIVEPNKSQRKNAASLAKDLIAKTSDTLEPYVQQVRVADNMVFTLLGWLTWLNLAGLLGWS